MPPESSDASEQSEGVSLETIDPQAAAELEQLSPELKARVELAVQTTIETQSHSGPLPSPSVMEEYEQVLPGLAERIVQLTEKEQSYRHEMGKNLLKLDYDLKSRGQWLGLTSLFAMLLIVAFMVDRDMGTAAAALGGAIIVGVVAVFVTGRAVGNSSDDEE